MPIALHSVSVAGVIVDDEGRALIIRRRDNGHWEPPGGVLELNESITDGLQHELKEETGLQVTIEGLTGVYKNMNRGIVALVFRCRTQAGHLTRNPEVAEFQWMGPEDVRRYLDEAYGVRVFDALECGTAAARAHDGTRVLPA